MSQKASLHFGSMKSMPAAQSNENERRGWNRESYDRNVNYSGKPCNYDWFRRHLNFEIVNGKICPMLSQGIPLHERLQNRLRELGFKSYKKEAKNAPNICMDFVIGGNRERLREMAFGNQEVVFGKNEERNSSLTRCKEIENWALDTYRWAAQKYGEENIVGFNVHLDETTPHIHMQVVPVREVKKRGRVKPGEERGTKLAVNYYGVVGNSAEERAAYIDNLHTDYHLQVGYKYGLERGTFYADLTPEEKALRKHRTGAEYVMFKETMKKVEVARKELDDIKAQTQQAEKKLKGLSTMIANLEEKRDNIELDIAGLEELLKNGEGDIENNTRKLEELKGQVSVLDEKLFDKRQKLRAAEQQLRDLDGRAQRLNNQKESLEKDIKTMADEAIRRHDQTNKAIADKRAELKKMDKSGELARAQRHIECRDAVLYRHWPEAQAAVKAIYERASSINAREFTQHQALDVEKAISTSGISRSEAADELLSLAQKDFDNNRTWQAWVNDTAQEVLSIVQGIHVLTPFLQQYGHGGGGGGGNNDLPRKKDDDRNTGYQAMKPKGRK